MLLNIKDKIIDIKDSEVLYNLYYNLAELPNSSLLKKKKIKKPLEYIIQLKEDISRLNNFIPLYDIFSKNIYLIKPNQIYDKIIKYYFRPLTNELLLYLKNIKTHDTTYKEKINKNIQFMNNFDLQILEETYIKTFYYESNKIGKNMTLCIKPSFIPFININPYYNRDELINLSLNFNIIKEDNTYYDKEKLDNLCLSVSNQDIDSDTLLNHYLFIQENNLKYFVKYYSFMGSYQMNNYIRNKSIKDSYIETYIKYFYNVISKSPAFNNNYYIYRLINKDNFLEHLKIDDIYDDYSFLSTSRNPFYNPVNNAFGMILMKIKMPKDISGVGLCIENYSLFPEEQEIILNPCRLKLVSKDDDSKSKNIIYYHTDKKAQRSIIKKYEFEYIEPLKLDLDKITTQYNKSLEIPIIDLYNTKLNGLQIDEKIESFSNMIPLINTMKRFIIEVGNKKYTINVGKMSDKRIYNQFFFLQKKKYNADDIIDELYLTYQDENSGEIILMIEIKDVLSINYLQKFTGNNKEISDKDLIDIVSGFSKMFEIYNVIIHPNFKPFSSFINVNPSDYKKVIDLETDYHDIKKLSNDMVLFNNDLMDFLITKKERFNNIYIKMNYKKSVLNRLSNIKVSEIFTIENYEIYSLIKNKNIDNITELLIFFFKNYFYLLDKVIYYINLYFSSDESDQLVINKLFYIFDTGNYLYELNKINYNIKSSDLITQYIDKLDVYNVKDSELR